MKFVVAGAGSWGSAFADYLARTGFEVVLWGRDKEKIDVIRETLENPHYLQGVSLHPSIQFSSDLKQALKNTDVLVNAIASQQVRSFLRANTDVLSTVPAFLNLSKGIENHSLELLHEVFLEELGDISYAVLSGPSHAEEVSRQMPTTLVCASNDTVLAEQIQAISSSSLRIYRSDDLIGVESGGALKNIIAIAIGICDGLGLGDNTKAAIMTRGMHEITNLGLGMGARLETYLGLSGIGDLIVTCTSKHSRNRGFGELLGKGYSTEKALQEIGMVVEGLATLDSAIGLSKRYSIEMPLCQALYEFIHLGSDLREIVSNLMEREYKKEFDL